MGYPLVNKGEWGLPLRAPKITGPRQTQCFEQVGRFNAALMVGSSFHHARSGRNLVLRETMASTLPCTEVAVWPMSIGGPSLPVRRAY